MYDRIIASEIAKQKRSVLLLGPRQVGKSTLMAALRPDLKINLANEAEYLRFQMEPDELERRIGAMRTSSRGMRTVFIDEIQRIPRLTNTIQALIDEAPNLRFLLTGSSARKLRKGRANLLPGRILTYTLGPLTLGEIGGGDWDEEQALGTGTLPGIYSLSNTKEKKELLRSYTATYLKEEILAEAVVRQVDGFVRFLNAAGAYSGRFLDYSKLAKIAKVPRQSVVRHFEILEDTLIVRKTENDTDLDSDGVDLVKHPRFFFFDVGVLNAIKRSFSTHQERAGMLFEHLVFNQFSHSANALNGDVLISNFRTRGGLEVDFIVNNEGKKFAVECKASSTVSGSELTPLRRLDTYYSKIQKLVVYRGKRELKDDGIWIVPLAKGLEIMGLK
jgi:predicted AAA+ superfamily ATPase